MTKLSVSMLLNRLLGLFLMTLLSVTSFAETASPAQKDPDPVFNNDFVRQTNHCQFANEEFDLLSVGTKNEFDNEESYFGAKTLWIRPKGKAPVLASRNDKLEYGEFSVTRFGDTESLENCFGVPAIPMGENILAIGFIKDDRPGGESAGAIFYNVKTRQVLASEILGTLANRHDGFFSDTRARGLSIMTEGPALYLLTAESRSEANGSQAMIAGWKQNFRDFDLGVIKRFTWLENKVVGQEDFQATWKLTPWHWYFKDEAEFKKLAGWDEATKTFAHKMIFATRNENSAKVPRCFQFANKMSELKKDSWLCRTMK